MKSINESWGPLIRAHQSQCLQAAPISPAVLYYDVIDCRKFYIYGILNMAFWTFTTFWTFFAFYYSVVHLQFTFGCTFAFFNRTWWTYYFLHRTWCSYIWPILCGLVVLVRLCIICLCYCNCSENVVLLYLHIAVNVIVINVISFCLCYE